MNTPLIKNHKQHFSYSELPKAGYQAVISLAMTISDNAIST